MPAMQNAPPNAKFPLEKQLGYQLRRASQAMMSELSETLAQIGLKPSSASVLLLIESGEAVTPSDLGGVLGIKRPNMTPIAAELERLGLVRRTLIDGRWHCLELTRAGAARARKARELIGAHEARFEAKFSAGEVALLLKLLPRIWTAPPDSDSETSQD